MRLQAIKLSGFKSFVDPVTVPLTSNLCAIVGPNGCGKSNIIDAVRWVMGESSARSLRGESMTDVIFNGSIGRKPVGQASIELIFDNSQGRLSGAYASYSEISIRRQVNRDHRAGYYLNGQKCRRRDITDVFLGTGLGPGSYAIIEQGMISNLIEAKPEELRIYIEEAAGISKYKARRKETERRITHTKDNLARLGDLRDELGRQIHHLERQAKAAERYKALKREERAVQSQLQALKWQTINQEARVKEGEIKELQIEQEIKLADQHRGEAKIEQKRERLMALNEQANDVQKRYYDYGAEISRIEDNIKFHDQQNQQRNTDLKETTSNWYKIGADIDGDQHALGELNRQLQHIEPQRDQIKAAEESSALHLDSLEEAMQLWQETWEHFNVLALQSQNKSQVQQSRIEALEQSIGRVNSRINTLKGEVARLENVVIEDEIGPLAAMMSSQTAQVARIEAKMQVSAERIDNQRDENHHTSASLDKKRRTLHALKGRHASLEALQQAALGQQDDARNSWLDNHDLKHNMRLGEQIKVAEPWAIAVETVLGGYLQAVCVDDLEPLQQMLTNFDKGTLTFISQSCHASSSQSSSRDLSTELILSKVSSDVSLHPMLGGVYCANDLGSALQRRKSLQAGESVITPEGIWLGNNWLRVSKDQDATAGVISRQSELKHLETDIAALESEVIALHDHLDGGVAMLQMAESEREQQANRLAEQQGAFSETRAQLNARRLKAEQIKADLARANTALENSIADLETDQVQLKEHSDYLQAAMDQMAQDTLRREVLQQERHEKQKSLETARTKAHLDRDAFHQLALRIRTLTSQVAATEQAITRLQAQQSVLAERRAGLEDSISNSEAPQAQLKIALEAQLGERLLVETQLTQVRQQSTTVEHEIRNLEQQGVRLQENVEQVSATLNQVRMDWQALEVRSATIKEQLEAAEHNLDTIIASLNKDANAPIWEQNLLTIGNRIQRLGAINLAAIEEFRVQSERKQYLDTQNDDLETALNTLENAIRKIDIETRTRFKETFDAVNSKLQQIFPKLFGGGHAYLEMIGKDLLDTGVSLMARPPGKRNANIHLLSGGEKALMAIALVFSIFSLNPAPFCMLDEVDAPLDDTNVVRYSNLVKEMSATVQFIHITHNKVAMEMAEQLMGVTMYEPGVSRLVSVEVDDAVAMAAV